MASFQVSLPLMRYGNQDNDFDKLCPAEFVDSNFVDSTPVFLCHLSTLDATLNPVGIYLLKVNNRNTRARCETCSKLTIKTPERRHWRRSGVFIVNLEHVSRLVLVFLLLTLNM